jgi:hypothetical protein
MEKERSSIAGDGCDHVTAPPTQRRRRVFTRDSRLAIAFTFVLTSCLWVSHLLNLLPAARTVCGRPLSVQERAAIILTKNPLIGWSHGAHATLLC